METLASTRDPGTPAGQAGGIQIVSGVKVVESPPGAPFPEGVPPWAFRCEIEEVQDCPPRWRPWFAGAGIAGAVGRMIATYLGYHWGFVPVPLACVGIWWGLRSGRTTVLRREANGRYLAYDDREPRDDSGDQAVSIIFGALMLGCAGLALLGGEEPDWFAAGALGSFGIALVYYGITGRRLDSDEFDHPPGTAEFRALADPRRPLGAPSPVVSDAEPEPPSGERHG